MALIDHGKGGETLGEDQTSSSQLAVLVMEDINHLGSHKGGTGSGQTNGTGNGTLSEKGAEDAMGLVTTGFGVQLVSRCWGKTGQLQPQPQTLPPPTAPPTKELQLHTVLKPTN